MKFLLHANQKRRAPMQTTLITVLTHNFDVNWPNFKFIENGIEVQGSKFYHFCENSSVVTSKSNYTLCIYIPE